MKDNQTFVIIVKNGFISNLKVIEIGFKHFIDNLGNERKLHEHLCEAKAVGITAVKIEELFANKGINNNLVRLKEISEKWISELKNIIAEYPEVKIYMAGYENYISQMQVMLTENLGIICEPICEIEELPYIGITGNIVGIE